MTKIRHIRRAILRIHSGGDMMALLFHFFASASLPLPSPQSFSFRATQLELETVHSREMIEAMRSTDGEEDEERLKQLSAK